MRIDPRHLAQLSTIVEAGTFQAAAERLGLTQPALSRNIRTLETRLGAPVFDRRARRAVPTDLGRRLADSGLAIRAAEERAARYATLAARGAAGELRLGAPPIIAGQFLSGVVSRFLRDRYDVTVELRVGLVQELRLMLERERIDLAIAPETLADGLDGALFHPIVDDRVGIVCRSEHALARRARVPLAALRRARWVAHSRGSTLRRQTEGALGAMGLDPIPVAVETDSIHSVMEIVARTDLLSTLPRESARPYLNGAVCFLPLDHPRFHRPIGVIHRETMVESAVARAFLTALLDGPGEA